MTPDEKLAQFSQEMPPPPKAVGLYQPCLVVGTLCYTSGHIATKSDGSLMTGCLGKDADVATGQQAARQCGLAILSTVSNKLGSLKKVKRLVKLLGFVHCSDDFVQQPAVMNGCSELMKEVFGAEAGVGVRSAVGTNALPMGVMVEVEAVFELES